jgi:hypothetical protein
MGERRQCRPPSPRSALHEVAEGFAILTLLEDPVRAISDGDSFTIRAGCDKRIATCAPNSPMR